MKRIRITLAVWLLLAGLSTLVILSWSGHVVFGIFIFVILLSCAGSWSNEYYHESKKETLGNIFMRPLWMLALLVATFLFRIAWLAGLFVRKRRFPRRSNATSSIS